MKCFVRDKASRLMDGAEGQIRTDTELPPPVFETGASTISPLRHGKRIGVSPDHYITLRPGAVSLQDLAQSWCRNGILSVC